MNTKAKHLTASKCVLGEGPLWNPAREELAFVDIIGRRLLFWHADSGLREVALGQRVGAICAHEDGGFLAASERGLFRLDAETGAFADIGQDDIIPDTALMNDGKCDRQGRFVFGSKALSESEPLGRLMGYDGSALRRWGHGIVMNGPAFSPDGTRIYFADSPTRVIFTATWDLAAGELGKVAEFARLEADAGYPDGMTVDSEGCLWNAHWDGWRITRYRPDGTVEREIPVPVPRPTSVAFGGSDMKTLFITSARKGTDTDPGVSEPGSGDLFSVDTGVAGLVEPVFRPQPS
jgi:sugar lactone lactonase YvrE